MPRFFIRGGVHPLENKTPTASLAIQEMPPPSKVFIPMQQHIGAPCEPVLQVEKGSQVKIGEVIGDNQGFVTAPIHSTVSGSVIAIGPYRHPLGGWVDTITIESDGEERWFEGDGPPPDPDQLAPEEIRLLIRRAGIVGLGGATFPAHVKLSPPQEKPIDTVIINGAECEPYLTADHRIMLEQSAEIVQGLKAMIRALKAETGIIGIENNKADAIEKMTQAVSGEDTIRVESLETKYPQGAEKMLIYAITGRKVPSGGLPLDIGVVNHNVGTAVAISRALREGKPLIERVLTVTGDGIGKPANLSVRFGTLVRDVIDYCGGLSATTRKLIIGGPMMGLAQPDADVPVIKGTSGILALTDKDVHLADVSPCIRCAKCIDACPVQLMPTEIARAAEYNQFSRAEKLHAADCFECGCCAYVCPSRIPLTQWIRVAKAEALKAKK